MNYCRFGTATSTDFLRERPNRLCARVKKRSGFKVRVFGCLEKISVTCIDKLEIIIIFVPS